ncbi:hypothetical protein [Bacillus cereus]|uniref:hypothetical protein n=1 Tax=Bacillus cereus TaxID=1396 RepID=UPI003300C49A|nr:hypothetical protein [Bacillus cereus]HDR7712782.1 hypothetical protein [Bacillus cereus]
MKTGWFKDGDKSYYFSPKDNNKNYDGNTFNKGEMMAGRVYVKNGIATNESNSGGAWYYLNDKSKYGTIGHMVHDIKASVRNK